MAQDTTKTTRPTTGRCMVCHKDKPGLLPCDECGRPTCADCGTPITNDPAHRWCADCEERAAADDGWTPYTMDDLHADLRAADMADEEARYELYELL